MHALTSSVAHSVVDAWTQLEEGLRGSQPMMMKFMSHGPLQTLMHLQTRKS